MQRLVSLAFIVAILPLSVLAQVTGTIITNEGMALEGAEVRAFAIESDVERVERLRSENPWRTVLATARTGRDGRFSLTVEGHEAVDLLYSREGFAPNGVRVEPAGEIGAFMLRPAKSVRGMVTHGGKPVAGAVVRWTTWTVELLTRTDEEGRYSVPDPAVWKPSLEVHHPSLPFHRWSPGRFPAQYEPPPADIAVPGRKVSGMVVGPDDAPVAGAAIEIDGAPAGVTTAEGTFELEADPKWNEIRVKSGELVGSVRREGKAIRVRLTAASRLSGRVVDERGRGVRQATVSLTYAVIGYMATTSESFLTSDDGSFRSVPIMPGKYRLQVLRPGYAPAMSEITIGRKESASKEIVLTLAGTVEGAVRDEDRRPVAAAQVGIDDRSLYPFPRPTATTGPDGRYVILDAAAGVKSKVTARRTGYPSGSSETFETHAGVRVSGIDVTVPAGYLVTGRVVSAAGAPISGVRAGAVEHAQAVDQMFVEFPGMERMEWPETDSEGNFALRIGKGTWFFGFKAPGYVVRVTEGKSVDGPLSIGDVTLDEGGEIRGRVVRASGAPVEGAAVAIREPNIRFVNVVTDADGRFTLRDLPRRTFDLMVYKGDGSRVAKVVEVPAADVLIELPDVITIRGRVVDAETEKPIPDFMLGVTLSQPGGTGKSPYHAPDGSFEVEAVPAEGLTIVASAAGYAETRKLVDLVDGKAASETIEVALPRGIRVHGTVKDESGRPLEGVSVGYDKHVVMGRMGSMTMRESSVTTDANGTFAFDSVAPGKAQFGFSKQGYIRTDRTIDAAGPEETFDVEMSKGVAVRGIVVDEGGAPVVGATVNGSTSGAGRSRAGMRTEADGRFVLEPLEPGRVNVRASATSYADEFVRDVETASASELRIVMQRGATVEGRVAGLEPGELQEVTLGIGQEYERRVNAAGEFRIDGVKSGRTVVEAWARVGLGYRSAKPVEIDLVAGQTARVEIEFVAGTTLRGRVTLGEKPLAGASVRFRPKDTYAAGYVSTRADANGRYEAVGLVDGEYAITVTEPGSSRSYETSCSVSGPAELDIHLDEGKIDGRVVEAGTGKAVSGATVSVESGSGYTSLLTSTSVSDADGRFVILSAAKGALRISARKEGYGTVVREVTSDGAMAGLELEMVRASGTKLRVVDARDGRALLPTVTSHDLSGSVLATDRFQSMDEGSVTIELAPGQYLLEIGANGYAARRIRVTVPSGELRVALTPGGKLVMRAPLDRAYRVTVRDDAGNVVRGWPGAFQPTILVEGTTTISALSPGEYAIEAAPVAGGESKMHRVRIEEGATKEVVLE